MKRLLILALCIGCRPPATATISDIPGQSTKAAEDMKVGEIRWAPPTVMWVDSNGRCLINANTITLPTSTPGTIEITKTEKGFAVDIGKTDYQWNRCAEVGYPNDNAINRVVTEIKATGLAESR